MNGPARRRRKDAVAFAGRLQEMYDGAMMERWNPDLYLKYAYERTLPSRDLAARIDLPDARKIVDIGCGPGNSTKVLRDRWPDAEIAGLDQSEEMIRKARAAYPAGQWIVADAENWNPAGGYDIVFSNAALQWMNNQARVVTRLFSLLKDGGVLAVQVPLNSDSPINKARIAVSRRAEWRKRLGGCDSRLTFNDESFYYDLLSALTHRMELWITTYLHIMDSHQDLVEWHSSTGLKPYLARIDSKENKEKFKRQILEECREQYPIRRDGRLLFPFRRLFFIAFKEA